MQLKIDDVFAEKSYRQMSSMQLLDQIIEEMDLTPLMREYEKRTTEAWIQYPPPFPFDDSMTLQIRK